MKTQMLSVAALALAVAIAPAAAGAADEQAKERKVCRTYKVTGSLTRTQRVCRTEAEWRQSDESVRAGVDGMHNNASGGKICHPDPADPFQGCPG